MTAARAGLTLLLCLSIALAGCAPMRAIGLAGPEQTPAQADLKSRTDRYEDMVKEGDGPSTGGFAVAGAAIGAILLGAIALAAGAKPEHAAVIAAGGAAAGAAGGAALASETRRYARTEASLDQKIRAARRETAELRLTATAAEQVAADHAARAQLLRQDQAAGRVRESSVRGEAAAMRADRARMELAVAASDKIKRQVAEDLAVPGAAATLQAEMSALDTQAARLRRSIDSVSAALLVIES